MLTTEPPGRSYLSLAMNKIDQQRNVSTQVSLQGRYLTFPKHQILALPNFNLTKTAQKFSKRVANTVGKGEIARNEQFLLFPQGF